MTSTEDKRDSRLAVSNAVQNDRRLAKINSWQIALLRCASSRRRRRRTPGHDASRSRVGCHDLRRRCFRPQRFFRPRFAELRERRLDLCIERVELADQLIMPRIEPVEHFARGGHGRKSGGRPSLEAGTLGGATKESIGRPFPPRLGRSPSPQPLATENWQAVAETAVLACLSAGSGKPRRLQKPGQNCRLCRQNTCRGRPRRVTVKCRIAVPHGFSLRPILPTAQVSLQPSS
jgi:hypothetical protein